MARKLTGAQKVKLGQKGEQRVIKELKKLGAQNIWQAPGSKGASDVKAILNGNQYHFQIKTSSTNKVPNLTSKEKHRLNISSGKAKATSIKVAVTPKKVGFEYVNKPGQKVSFTKNKRR